MSSVYSLHFPVMKKSFVCLMTCIELLCCEKRRNTSTCLEVTRAPAIPVFGLSFIFFPFPSVSPQTPQGNFGIVQQAEKRRWERNLKLSFEINKPYFCKTNRCLSYLLVTLCNFTVWDYRALVCDCKGFLKYRTFTVLKVKN